MPQFERGEEEQEHRRAEKEKVWQTKLEEIGRIKDALGQPVDQEVREIIVGLNVFDISTSASCEGHPDRGRGAPWIKIEVPNRPPEQFVGEVVIIKKIAEQYHVPVEDVRSGKNEEAWNKAMNLASNNPETPEYQRWRKENLRLRDRLSALLEEFYRNRSAGPAIRLELMEDAEGTFRLHNGGEDYRTNSKDLREEERRALASRLPAYQNEMKAFTEFLHQKYFGS